MALTQIKLGGLAAESVDSDAYVDGSIDNAHLADDAANSDEIAAGAVDTAHIADNQVTLAKMAGGTDGNIISYDASGDPVAIATGTDGQVLTSTGAGSPPAMEDAPSFDADAAQAFNDTGAAVDFRIESDDNQNMFFLDGSEDKIGIGTASPATALHVASGAVDSLTVASSVDGCKINMKDSGSTAGIDLYADDENFGIYVNDALKFYIGSTGLFSMGSALQFAEAAKGLITIDFESTNTITVASAANLTFFLAFYKQTTNGNNSAVIGYVAIEDAAIQPSGLSIHHNLPGLSASSTSRTQIKLGNTAENSSAISVHYTIYKVGVDNS